MPIALSAARQLKKRDFMFHFLQRLPNVTDVLIETLVKISMISERSAFLLGTINAFFTLPAMSSMTGKALHSVVGAIADVEKASTCETLWRHLKRAFLKESIQKHRSLTSASPGQ